MIDGQNAQATEQTSGQSMADLASSIPERESVNTEQQSQQAPDNISEFEQFVQKNAQTTNELASKVEQISKAHEDLVNSQLRNAVNKEIESAADTINSDVGGDKDMARLYLEAQYKKDPNLQKVWDNRGENPEALSKALGLLANEWKAKNQNLIDPQVAENQRALSDSQRSGGTVQAQDLDTELSSMNDADFMRTMRKMSI